MAPVTSPAIDQAVPLMAQSIATGVTCVIAIAALIPVLIMCWRRRILWPLLVVVSGTLAFLMEPMYDHFYGLWFFEQGQVNAVTTYGIHVPLWLPIIYIAYYGCGTVWYWSRLERGAGMKTLMTYFGIEVLLAGLAEQFYINVVGLYNYQDIQPFMVLNYPIFVAVINGVPPALAGIMLFKLVPVLKGWEKLALLPLVPVAFAANTFGGGWLYLATRHSENPSTLMLHVTALTAVACSIGVIWAAGRMAGIGRPKLTA